VTQPIVIVSSSWIIEDGVARPASEPAVIKGKRGRPAKYTREERAERRRAWQRDYEKRMRSVR